MATSFLVPPTFAPPFILKDGAEDLSDTTINPIWLDWFLRVAQIIDPPTTPHNNLPGLQGGAPGEYFHFDSADYAALLAIIAGGGGGGSDVDGGSAASVFTPPMAVDGGGA